jgi:hypothetical protein
MDIDVLGYLPDDPVKGMEVLTKAFGKLRFNYLDRQYLWFPLGKIGYFFDELSRDKIYLTTVPEDTYSYESCMESWSSDRFRCKPIYIFIDVGSPFRHVILVEDNPLEPEKSDPQIKSFQVTGLYVVGSEYYELLVTFRSADWISWNCEASFCTEKYIETVEKLASDEEIHFMVYPRADKRTKRLFNAIMDAVANSESKQAKSSSETKS